MQAPRIFYYCYDSDARTGGQKHSYEHVDVLNRNGFEAYAFHRKPGFRLDWFDNDTRVGDAALFAQLYDPERDVLVFPEDFGARMLEYPAARVVFNKKFVHRVRIVGKLRGRGCGSVPRSQHHCGIGGIGA